MHHTNQGHCLITFYQFMSRHGPGHNVKLRPLPTDRSWRSPETHSISQSLPCGQQGSLTWLLPKPPELCPAQGVPHPSAARGCPSAPGPPPRPQVPLQPIHPQVQPITSSTPPSLCLTATHKPAESPSALLASCGLGVCFPVPSSEHSVPSWSNEETVKDV